MPDTRTTLLVNNAPLSADDLEAVQSVTLREELGSQDRISVAVAMTTDNASGWSSPLDDLVAPRTPLTATIERGPATYTIDARTVSASWHLAPGGLSTLTVEALDRSVDMDREDRQEIWNLGDSAIAEKIFTRYGLAAQADSTPTGSDADVYSPQQNGTDWAFVKELAARNGFDVRVESINGVATGVFGRIDPLAAPQTALALGYGALGGEADAAVQLLAGHEVHVTRSVPGTSDTETAKDTGTGNAMGRISLGGASIVRTNTSDGTSVVSAQATATAIAERSAFGASLGFTLTAPDAPLVRARRTITIGGLGDTLNGLWLVKSVTHTINPGGHTQRVELIRNALGDLGAGGAAGALAAGARALAAAL
jgi:phage protein D